MSIQSSLRTLMLASPDVVAAVGSRVYTVTLPQEEDGVQALPAIVQRMYAQERLYELENGATHKFTTMEVECFAVDYAGARALADAADACWNGYRGNVGDTQFVSFEVLRQEESYVDLGAGGQAAFRVRFLLYVTHRTVPVPEGD